MKKFSLVLIVVAVFALVLGPALARAEHTYVGADKCKMCHKVQFESWSKTKHATAFDSLKPEDQKKAECVGCHTTGSEANHGVQCEACHGAGSDYKAMATMKDLEKAKAAGLTMPDEAYCTTKCHNNKSPNFKPFDFKTAVTKVHDHKVKAK